MDRRNNQFRRSAGENDDDDNVNNNYYDSDVEDDGFVDPDNNNNTQQNGIPSLQEFLSQARNNNNNFQGTTDAEFDQILRHQSTNNAQTFLNNDEFDYNYDTDDDDNNEELSFSNEEDKQAMLNTKRRPARNVINNNYRSYFGDQQQQQPRRQMPNGIDPSLFDIPPNETQEQLAARVVKIREAFLSANSISQQYGRNIGNNNDNSQKTRPSKYTKFEKAQVDALSKVAPLLRLSTGVGASDYDLIMRRLDDAIACDPLSPHAAALYHNRAVVRSRLAEKKGEQNPPHAALVDARLATHLNFQNPSFWILVGTLASQLSEFEEALDAYETGMKLADINIQDVIDDDDDDDESERKSPSPVDENTKRNFNALRRAYLENAEAKAVAASFAQLQEVTSRDVDGEQFENLLLAAARLPDSEAKSQYAVLLTNVCCDVSVVQSILEKSALDLFDQSIMISAPDHQKGGSSKVQSVTLLSLCIGESVSRDEVSISTETVIFLVREMKKKFVEENGRNSPLWVTKCVTCPFDAVTENPRLDILKVLLEHSSETEEERVALKNYINEKALLHRILDHSRPAIKWNPYFSAAALLECVKLLVEYGADVNKVDHNVWIVSPLYLACREEEFPVELVSFLVEKGADVNFKRTRCICDQCRVEGQKLLKKAEVFQSEHLYVLHNIDTPLEAALFSAHSVDAAKVLRKAGAKFSPSLNVEYESETVSGFVKTVDCVSSLLMGDLNNFGSFRERQAIDNCTVYALGLLTSDLVPTTTYLLRENKLNAIEKTSTLLLHALRELPRANLDLINMLLQEKFETTQLYLPFKVEINNNDNNNNAQKKQQTAPEQQPSSASQPKTNISKELILYESIFYTIANEIALGYNDSLRHINAMAEYFNFASSRNIFQRDSVFRALCSAVDRCVVEMNKKGASGCPLNCLNVRNVLHMLSSLFEFDTRNVNKNDDEKKYNIGTIVNVIDSVLYFFENLPLCIDAGEKSGITHLHKAIETAVVLLMPDRLKFHLFDFGITKAEEVQTAIWEVFCSAIPRLVPSKCSGITIAGRNLRKMTIKAMSEIIASLGVESSKNVKSEIDAAAARLDAFKTSMIVGSASQPPSRPEPPTPRVIKKLPFSLKKLGATKNSDDNNNNNNNSDKAKKSTQGDATLVKNPSIILNQTKLTPEVLHYIAGLPSLKNLPVQKEEPKKKTPEELQQEKVERELKEQQKQEEEKRKREQRDVQRKKKEEEQKQKKQDQEEKERIEQERKKQLEEEKKQKELANKMKELRFSLSSSSSESASSSPAASATSTPTKAEGFFIEGKFRQALDAFTAALKEIQKSKGSNNNNNNLDRAVLLSNRALCYIELKNFDKAYEDTTAALQADSSWSKTHLRHAIAAEKLSKFDEAQTSLQTCTKIDPAASHDPLVKEKIKSVSAEINKLHQIEVQKRKKEEQQQAKQKQLEQQEKKREEEKKKAAERQRKLDEEEERKRVERLKKLEEEQKKKQEQEEKERLAKEAAEQEAAAAAEKARLEAEAAEKARREQEEREQQEREKEKDDERELKKKRSKEEKAAEKARKEQEKKEQEAEEKRKRLEILSKMKELQRQVKEQDKVNENGAPQQNPNAAAAFTPVSIDTSILAGTDIKDEVHLLLAPANLKKQVQLEIENKKRIEQHERQRLQLAADLLTTTAAPQQQQQQQHSFVDAVNLAPPKPKSSSKSSNKNSALLVQGVNFNAADIMQHVMNDVNQEEQQQQVQEEISDNHNTNNPRKERPNPAKRPQRPPQEVVSRQHNNDHNNEIRHQQQHNSPPVAHVDNNNDNKSGGGGKESKKPRSRSPIPNTSSSPAALLQCILDEAQQKQELEKQNSNSSTSPSAPSPRSNNRQTKTRQQTQQQHQRPSSSQQQQQSFQDAVVDDEVAPSAAVPLPRPASSQQQQQQQRQYKSSAGQPPRGQKNPHNNWPHQVSIAAVEEEHQQTQEQQTPAVAPPAPARKSKKAPSHPPSAEQQQQQQSPPSYSASPAAAASAAASASTTTTSSSKPFLQLDSRGRKMPSTADKLLMDRFVASLEPGAVKSHSDLAFEVLINVFSWKNDDDMQEWLDDKYFVRMAIGLRYDLNGDGSWKVKQ